MTSVDTNVLVRYLVKDDHGQTVLATNFLANNRCLVLKTVLLELVWVLSSPAGYNLPRKIVHERLLHLLGLSCIETEDAVNVAHAINWYSRGMDFADALHLSGSSECAGIATFDRKFVATAEKFNVVPSVVLVR